MDPMKTLSKRFKQLALAAALVPAVAAAEVAVTTQGVNMRAGPDASYPQVAYLGPGFRVDVQGCVEGWQWCDVIAGPNRGWVYAGYLSYGYGNNPTVISYGGPTLGIPLISFSIGSYWDNYYRSRPFWRDRARWYNHRVAHAPEWRPPHGWHGNDWRHDNRGNDWRHDNRGNDWRANDNRRGHDGRGNDGWRGRDDGRVASDHRPVQQDRGRSGPGRPDESGRGDGFHADQQ
jgi:uncharacterized protein YraI